MAVKTWFSPFGATLRTPVSRIEAQSWEGKFPKAGRLISADAICSLKAVAWSAGLL